MASHKAQDLAKLGVELAELVKARMGEWTQFTVHREPGTSDSVWDKAAEILKVKGR